MQKNTLLVCGILFLTGCGNQLVNQAVRDAKQALNDQNYERAISLLLVAEEEGAEAEVSNLQVQIDHLLSMKNYLGKRKLDPALLMWTELNLSPSETRMVKEEAERLLQEEITETASRVKANNRAADLDYAHLLIQRLAAFEAFQEEVDELREAVSP